MASGSGSKAKKRSVTRKVKGSRKAAISAEFIEDSDMDVDEAKDEVKGKVSQSCNVTGIQLIYLNFNVKASPIVATPGTVAMPDGYMNAPEQCQSCIRRREPCIIRLSNPQGACRPCVLWKIKCSRVPSRSVSCRQERSPSRAASKGVATRERSTSAKPRGKYRYMI